MNGTFEGSGREPGREQGSVAPVNGPPYSNTTIVPPTSDKGSGGETSTGTEGGEGGNGDETANGDEGGGIEATRRFVRRTRRAQKFEAVVGGL